MPCGCSGRLGSPSDEKKQAAASEVGLQGEISRVF